jgi:hypothetical protein
VIVVDLLTVTVDLPVGLNDVVTVNVEPFTDVTGPEIEPLTGDAADATPASAHAAATTTAPAPSVRLFMCPSVQAAPKNRLRPR